MSGYKLYMREGWQKGLEYYEERLVVKQELIVGHVRWWANPSVVDHTFTHPFEGFWTWDVLPWNIGFKVLHESVSQGLQEWAAQVADERGVEHWALVCGVIAGGQQHDSEK